VTTHRVYDDGTLVRLTDQELIGAGGEGAVYAVGPVAYKIYHDVARALPVAKIVELSRISHTHVNKPERPITNSKGVVVGYRTAFASNCKTLCEVSTRAYRDRHGMIGAHMEAIVGDMEEILHKVHEAGVVVVDFNDLNVLVRSSHREVVLIDLDSAQTPSFNVTAIMDIVRDPVAPPGRYKPESDWFAFAVLAFRAFTGSGPYRGHHPQGGRELDRKDKGQSAFDVGARLPASAFPLDVIPQRYRDWMRLTLSHKLRAAPGSTPIAAMPVQVAAYAAQGRVLVAVELGKVASGQVLRAWMVGTKLVVLTMEGLWYEGRLVKGIPSSARLAVHPRSGAPLLAWVERTITPGGSEDRLVVFDAQSGAGAVTDIKADDLAEAGPNILVRVGGGIHRLSWIEKVGGPPIVGLDRVANCLPRATLLGDGAAVIRGLGRVVLLLLPDAQKCIEIPLPDLDDSRVVSVRADKHVAVLGVVRKKTGQRDLILVRVNPDQPSLYDVRVISDAGSEADLVVGASGAVAVRTDDGVRLMSSRVGASQEAAWDLPPGVQGPLLNLGGRVASVQGDRVVQLRTAP